MRIIGLDLVLTAEHKALIADAQGQPLAPILQLRTTASDLERLFQRTREGAAPDEPVWLIMEPTGMAWFPVAAYAQPRGVIPSLVNSQQVADLRRYYKKHAKSDRIDVLVLVKLAVVSPEKLHPLCPAQLCSPVSAAVRNWITSRRWPQRSRTAFARLTGLPGPAWTRYSPSPSAPSHAGSMSSGISPPR